MSRNSMWMGVRLKGIGGDRRGESSTGKLSRSAGLRVKMLLAKDVWRCEQGRRGPRTGDERGGKRRRLLGSKAEGSQHASDVQARG